MPRKTTARPLKAAIPTASALLAAICAGCGSAPAARPDLPVAWHVMEPGSTNTVVVPPDCLYGVWTTDRGLLYIQGLLPED